MILVFTQQIKISLRLFEKKTYLEHIDDQYMCVIIYERVFDHMAMCNT